MNINTFVLNSVSLQNAASATAYNYKHSMDGLPHLVNRTIKHRKMEEKHLSIFWDNMEEHYRVLHWIEQDLITHREDFLIAGVYVEAQMSLFAAKTELQKAEATIRGVVGQKEFDKLCEVIFRMGEEIARIKETTPDDTWSIDNMVTTANAVILGVRADLSRNHDEYVRNGIHDDCVNRLNQALADFESRV